MTLDPVFRSRAAVRQIEEDGFLASMAGSLRAHRAAVAHIHSLMPEVIGERYIGRSELAEDEVGFLQNHFFLVLFHSIFEVVGAAGARLELYARLNFCIKGIVTAGDNLFDDEGKRLLPLALEGGGTRFESILQLLCFDRLSHRVLDAGVVTGALARERVGHVHRGILDRLAQIGSLEGSEERGVDTVLTPDEMVERVHRVRGGALFSLAFIAPQLLEEGTVRERFVQAEAAVRKLGTAFQIVDDLTDFEFDLARRSHNILVASAHHEGDETARAAIADLLKGKPPAPHMVTGVFGACARRVLERAREEGRQAFRELSALGFWFPPERADSLVHAIVGHDGIARMESLADDGA